MGYQCKLFMLRREDGPVRGCVVWSRSWRLNLGHVTRIEKIIDTHFGHLTWDSQSRAAICMVSILLGKRIFTQLDQGLSDVLAPPLLAYDDEEARTAALATATGDVIDLGPLQSYDYRQRGKVRKHNRFIARDADTLREAVRTCDPIMKEPFIWADTGALAEWLDEAEREGMEEWLALKEDEAALTLVCKWRTYLRRFESVGARALFMLS